MHRVTDNNCRNRFFDLGKRSDHGQGNRRSTFRPLILKSIMSNKEKSGSTPAGSKPKQDRRQQLCGRCRVHGDYVRKADHKEYCRHKNCACSKCYDYLQKQKQSAQQIARKRTNDLNRKKKISPEEVPALPFYLTNHKNGLHILLDYTWKEMHKSSTVWYVSSKIWHIFAILRKYADDLDAGLKIECLLDLAKHHIDQASIIHQSKIIRRDIVQNVILSFIIIYLIYFPFSFKYYLFPP